MPCQSDYLAASGQELESIRVCTLLVYLKRKLNKVAPGWVIKAAGDYYGNVARLDEATKLLCELCRNLTAEEREEYIYNAHNNISRQLADWWERHQEWDERRVDEEEIGRQRVVTRARALKKLTEDELRALDLI